MMYTQSKFGSKGISNSEYTVKTYINYYSENIY